MCLFFVDFLEYLLYLDDNVDEESVIFANISLALFMIVLLITLAFSSLLKQSYLHSAVLLIHLMKRNPAADGKNS